MNEKNNIPRREREKLQRRSDILSAAKNVFAEQGFDHASLDEIASRCELSKGTLYYYFSGKEELFTSVIEEGYGEFMQKFNLAFEQESNREIIRAATKVLFGLFSEDYDKFRIIFRERMKAASGVKSVFDTYFRESAREIERRISEVLDRSKKAGEIHDYDSNALVHTLIGMIHFSAIQCGCGSQLDADTLVNILYDGIQK